MSELSRLKLNLRAIDDTYLRDNLEKIQDALNKLIDGQSSTSSLTSSSGSSTTTSTTYSFIHAEITVDQSLIDNREIILVNTPKQNSLEISLNGLEVESSDYSLSGLTLTIDAALVLAIGDNLTLRYVV